MKILSFLLIVFPIFLSSCIQLKPLTLRSVNCCELKKATNTEAEVALTLEVHNPNEFPVNIKRYCLDVMVNQAVIGTAEERTLTVIPANSTLKKSISMTASAEKLMGGTLMMGLGALMGITPQALEIELRGSIVGSAKGLSARMRVREKYPLKLKP